MSRRLFSASRPEQPTATSLPENMPRHIAIIMDGNGRWAKKRAMPRIAGHKRGAEALRTILYACRDMGVRYLTVYAFSSENWQRPQEEVSDLMTLLSSYLNAELNTLKENRIRLHIVGDTEKLPEKVQKEVEEAQQATAEFDEFHLAVCLSYGARQEMTSAMRTLAEDVAAGRLSPDAITEEAITARLFTHDLPEPDLLIRTGGEQRLSNFLLWQAAYTELYFSDVLWPDFTGDHLLEACREFSTRERRYGKI